MEYQEHEGTFEQLASRLDIKLNLASLAKSEGLTPEEAKKCVLLLQSVSWMDRYIEVGRFLLTDRTPSFL